ncbi:MAG: tRNA-intron lyase [Conexivisphaerales archaeon]
MDSTEDSLQQQDQEQEQKLSVTFAGKLKGYRVIVERSDISKELTKRGLGDEEADFISLRIYEAMYMVRQGWLSVSDAENNAVSFQTLVARCLSEDKRGWTKFLVYRDLRSRGYVVREGYGIRSDLRVYDRGDYPSTPAKYTVLPINEGEKVRLSELEKMLERVYMMGKEAIVAVVERRGEIIYYRASRMNFSKN